MSLAVCQASGMLSWLLRAQRSSSERVRPQNRHSRQALPEEAWPVCRAEEAWPLYHLLVHCSTTVLGTCRLAHVCQH